MKYTIAILLLTVQVCFATTNTISSLTQNTSPSTNTWIEVADLSATPKSGKVLLSSVPGIVPMIVAAGQFQTFQDTITHAGTVTLDFSTTNAHSLTLTGNVTFAFSNLATNRTVRLLIIGCSTNSSVTWPAGVHGQLPALSEASKWILCWLEAWGTTASATIGSSLLDP
jgi:hypothetical protein